MAKRLYNNKIISQLKKWGIYNPVIEFCFVFLGLGVILLIFNIFPLKFFKSPYRETICTIIIILFFALFLIINRRKSRFKILKVNYNMNIILFVLFISTILNFLFFAADFPLYGIEPDIDNWFRASLVEKISQDGILHDFAYKNLSSFYPPLYWYILGLSSKILGIPAYMTLKYSFLVAWIILPILVYEFWKRIYSEQISFTITVIFFTFVANFSYTYIVDHLISLIFLIPYIIYYLENIKEKHFKWIDYLIAGLIGVILFSIYYLYFFLIFIYYLIDFIKNPRLFIRVKLKRLFIIFSIIGILSSYYWFPLMLDIINLGFESHQNHFIRGGIIEMPLYVYITPTLISIILVSGAFYLIVKFRDEKDIKILTNLIISNFIIYLIGFIGILIGFPIMHDRFLPIFLYILIIGFGIVYIKFFAFLNKQKVINFPKVIMDNLDKIMIYLLIILIVYQNFVNTRNLYKSTAYHDTLRQEIPIEKINNVKALDYKNKVFLTTHPEVVPYLPIYLFLSPKIHFTHPSALYMERVAFLKDLEDSYDAEEFYLKIINCKFDLINFFYIDDHNTTHLSYTAEIHNYPESPLTQKFYYPKNYFNNQSYFLSININNTLIYETVI